MGCFDTVWVVCPHCDRHTGLQSKAGDCSLTSYEFEDAPLEILASLASRDGWKVCNHCNGGIEVRFDTKPTFSVVKAGNENA